MFSEACRKAGAFTRPVVISSRSVDGTCASVICACVVLNEEGWILTAAHVIKLIRKQAEEAGRVRKYRDDVRQQDRDLAATKRQRKNKLYRFDRPGRKMVQDHSVWWGADGAGLTEVRMNPTADLAAGRLAPFDPGSVSCYPVFKTAGADYLPGRSLCKLGFPFHEITPVFDEKRRAFVLPEGSVPLPLFPLEGMFTRILMTSMADKADDGDGGTSEFIELSSPGLRGQSGGPIFDTEGRVWGLQSHTRHHPLGFAPHSPAQARGQTEHQFLNVGVGVHAAPLRRFLEENGIAHRRAP